MTLKFGLGLGLGRLFSANNANLVPWYLSSTYKADNQSPSLILDFANERYAVAQRYPTTVVTSQNRFHRDTYTSASYDTYACRMAVYVAVDCYDICASFFNFWLDALSVQNMGNSVDILDVALDNGAGTAVSLKFSGVSSRTLTNGETDARTDYVRATAFGQDYFTRGQILYIKWVTKVAVAGTGKVGYSIYRGKNTGEQMIRFLAASTSVSAANVAGDFTTTGAAPESTGSFMPMAPVILGRPVSKQDTYVFIGDSISGGAQEAANADGIYGTGYFQRAMSQTDHSQPLASIHFGRGGSFSNYLTGYESYVNPYIALCNQAIIMTGTNDINTAPSTPLATLQAKLVAVYTNLNSQGITRITQSLLLPKTTSTDGWSTTANQTVSAGWGSGELAEQYNNWIISGGSGYLQGYIDTVDARDTVDPYKWKVGGATSDGVHPTTSIHILLAVKARAKVAATRTSTTTPSPSERPLSDILTVTRGSTATYFGKNGLMQTAAINALRLDYDPLTRQPKGALIEEQRSNLIIQSNLAADAAVTGAVNTAGPAAIDGSTVCRIITEDTSTGGHRVFQATTFSVTSGSAYSGHAYLKAGTQTIVQLTFQSALFSGSPYANFDLVNGVITASGGGATASIQAIGDGWYRCSITATATATGGNVLAVRGTNNNGTATFGPTYTGTGLFFYIWGWQCEQGSFPTSFIYTTGAAATRSADRCIAGAANTVPFADWYNASSGAIYTSAHKRFADEQDCSVLMLGDGTANNAIKIHIDYTASGARKQDISTAGALQFSHSGAAYSPGSLSKTAITAKLNDAISCVGGTLSAADTILSLPAAPTMLEIGSALSGAGSELNGHIAEIRFYGFRMTNAEIQRITG